MFDSNSRELLEDLGLSANSHRQIKQHLVCQTTLKHTCISKWSVVFTFVFLNSSFMSPVQAWQHEVGLGYGFGHEYGETNYNYGYFLHAKFYKFKKVDKTLFLTLDASLGYWWTHTPTHRRITNIAFSPAFRAYFAPPEHHTVRPYLEFAFGPTYLSSKQFGYARQGAQFAFQTVLGGGVEIGNQQRSVDLSIFFLHYCNAGLFTPNIGFDIPVVFIFSYQF